VPAPPADAPAASGSTNAPSAAPGPSPEERAATEAQLARLQDYAAGFFGIWTLDLGLKHGLFASLAKHPEGISPEFLAKELDLDRMYVTVWCNAAYSLHLAEHNRGVFTLAPGLQAPLLEPDSPVYFGGTARFLGSLRDQLGFLHAHFADGDHSWWNEFAPEVSETQADSSRTFYTRLLRKGFREVPGLVARLEADPPAEFVELGCGRAAGLLRIAHAFPKARFHGVDGDEENVKAATEAVAKAGLSDRVAISHAILEKGPLPPADVVLMNISLHETQDKEAVVKLVAKSLRPKGTFLVSEFPFPEWGDLETLRTPAGKVMAGVQYLEAILNDQLLPAAIVLNLLRRAGMRDVSSKPLAPIHVLIWATR
jgi:SAM-dependent methyltransferase